VRFSRSHHPFGQRVLETLSSSQSIQTRRDEPFKSTAAILDVSTRSVAFFAPMLTIPMHILSLLCIRRRQDTLRKAAVKDLLRRLLRLAKPFRARVPHICVIALNRPALAPDCLFIGSLSDVPGNPADSTSPPTTWLTANRYRSFIYTKRLRKVASAEVLFFRAAACGKPPVPPATAGWCCFRRENPSVEDPCHPCSFFDVAVAIALGHSPEQATSRLC